MFFGQQKCPFIKINAFPNRGLFPGNANKNNSFSFFGKLTSSNQCQLRFFHASLHI